MIPPRELARISRAKRKEYLLARSARQVKHSNKHTNKNASQTVTSVSCVTNGKFILIEF